MALAVNRPTIDAMRLTIDDCVPCVLSEYCSYFGPSIVLNCAQSNVEAHTGLENLSDRYSGGVMGLAGFDMHFSSSVSHV